MSAIEFKADIHDGVIEIPKEYRGKLGDHVKVIALINDAVEESDPVQYSDEYLEKHWRELIVTSTMSGDFESSDVLRGQREAFLMEKYK